MRREAQQMEIVDCDTLRYVSDNILSTEMHTCVNYWIIHYKV